MAKVKKATFTELRNNAASFFDRVEEGETIQIYRHGKLAAMLIPAVEETLNRWKTATPVDLGGLSLSEAILSERRSTD